MNYQVHWNYSVPNQKMDKFPPVYKVLGKTTGNTIKRLSSDLSQIEQKLDHDILDKTQYFVSQILLKLYLGTLT